MSKFINNSFVNMAKQGILGAIFGLFAGEILGILIYFIQFLLVLGTNQVQPGSADMLFFPSATIPAGLGAGFGAVIGAIFGAISALKENSKK